jgi:hypothetical protein
VCHWLDTTGVNGLHFFNQREYSIQVAERAFRFSVADFDPGEMGNAPDLFQGKRHGYEISKVLIRGAI